MNNHGGSRKAPAPSHSPHEVFLFVIHHFSSYAGLPIGQDGGHGTGDGKQRTEDREHGTGNGTGHRANRTGQDRAGLDGTGQDGTGQDRTDRKGQRIGQRTGQNRTADRTEDRGQWTEDRTGQDRTGKDKTGAGQDSSGQDRTGTGHELFLYQPA